MSLSQYVVLLNWSKNQIDDGISSPINTRYTPDSNCVRCSGRFSKKQKQMASSNVHKSKINGYQNNKLERKICLEIIKTRLQESERGAILILLSYSLIPYNFNWVIFQHMLHADQTLITNMITINGEEVFVTCGLVVTRCLIT